MKSPKIIGLVIAINTVFSIKATAQNAIVEINHNCERFIGEISDLDRTKYFSVHDTGNDADQLTFRQNYNVTGGRQFWGPFARAKQVTGAVGVYPAYKPGNDDLRLVKKGFVSTQHPGDAFKDGLDVNTAADWAVEYFKDQIANGEALEFFEVMNEPFVHARDFYTGSWNNAENNRIKLQMAKFYKEVAKRIHDTPALDNMKVIGYSAAWPSMELNDFGHWNDNMKMFMDNAGEDMQAFSTHLYDGVNVSGQDNKRSGSNSEAILDLIENYSFIKWGKVKPHAITEYGAIEVGFGDDYSDIASAQTIASINHILFNLLDRENNLINSIPFITGKAEWHINAENNYQPYQAVLWKPTNLGEQTPAGWEYTPRINFYELWKDVKGKRVLISSTNPDIQTHAFVDNDRMYVALSNLHESTQVVNLEMLSSLDGFINVKTKALKIYPDALLNMSTTTANIAPKSITLIKDETVVLEYTFNNAITFDNALRLKKYYTTNYLESIIANTPISYNFNAVSLGDGFATLRMSIGRKHNVSKKPIIKINGTLVDVPDNWKGYDQANRDDFFGMIEIPFSTDLLVENNTVTVEFPDSGGRISSLIMSVDLYDKAIKDDTPDQGNASVTVKSIGNSCPNSTNGKISLKALKVDNYQVKIKGDAIDKTYDFSNEYSINNLAAGEYSVTIISLTNTGLKTHYTINISEPEPLSVSGKSLNTKGKKVSYNLKGGTNYHVKFNDKTYTTSKPTITFDLVNGANDIQIKADSDCQGLYNESILIGDGVSMYPNPVENILTVVVTNSKGNKISYELFSSSGSLLLDKTIKNRKNSFEINMSKLSSGFYYLKINSGNNTIKSKIIKK